MSKSQHLATFISQFFYTLQQLGFTWTFIKQHKLWRGLFNQTWITVIVLGTTGLLSYQFLHLGLRTVQGFIISASSSVDITEQGYQTLFSGGYKYLILLIFQILMFHITLKTKEILTGQPQNHSWQNFKSGFMRSAQIMVRYYLIETGIILLLGIGLPLLGVGFMKQALAFIIQCYFIGFALLDSYHEGNHLKIIASEKRTRRFAGVAVGLGLIYYVLVAIPVIGLIAPVLASVHAIVMMFWLDKPDQAHFLV